MKTLEWWRRGGRPCLMQESALLQSHLQQETSISSSKVCKSSARRNLSLLAGIFLHRRPNLASPAGRRFDVPYPLPLSTDSNSKSISDNEYQESGEELESEEWEAEDESEPWIGDGGDGGGINLGNIPWGAHALSLANEVLSRNFSNDFKIFAFKISPKGYIYIRLDKISNRYGCPEMEEIEEFSRLYDKCLEERDGGEIPEDLGLEVSSPGAERLLKVPEDLERFREMPMIIHYHDDHENKNEPNIGYLLLDSLDLESRISAWKLADVKENRTGKGRPLNRERRDWRLKLPFHLIMKAMLYVT